MTVTSPEQRKQIDRLDKLYSKIPSFECIPGCIDCCGPVPLSEIEAHRLNTTNSMTVSGMEPIQSRAQLEALTSDPTYVTPTCDYAVEGKGCTVYKNRPLTCRLYGTFERLVCPHGKRPAKMLSDEQETNIIQKYRKIAIKEID